MPHSCRTGLRWPGADQAHPRAVADLTQQNGNSHNDAEPPPSPLWDVGQSIPPKCLKFPDEGPKQNKLTPLPGCFGSCSLWFGQEHAPAEHHYKHFSFLSSKGDALVTGSKQFHCLFLFTRIMCRKVWDLKPSSVCLSRKQKHTFVYRKYEEITDKTTKKKDTITALILHHLPPSETSAAQTHIDKRMFVIHQSTWTWTGGVKRNLPLKCFGQDAKKPETNSQLKYL